MKFSHLPTTNLHDWASLRAQLLFIFDQPVSAKNINGRWNRKNELSAWLVRKGSVKVQVEGESCVCRQGQWLIMRAKQIEQEFSPRAHVLSLRIEQNWPDGTGLFSDGMKLLDAHLYPGLEKRALSLLRVMDTKVRWSEKAGDPRQVFLWKSRISYFDFIDYERDLLAWLKELAQAMESEKVKMHVPENVDPRLRKVFQALDLIHVGRAFPKEQVLQAGGLSLDRLNQLGLEAYGYTLHRYWENRRLLWACRRLEAPSARIKEVALELGFKEMSHFSAWFKRLEGKSPRLWRKRE